MPVSRSEFERYQRQLLVEDWDQERLANARVLIVGVGGLGSVSAMHLAAAGVGHLLLCDGDTVELSNLNRQTLFAGGDVGKPKAQLAAERLAAMNPHIEIEAVSAKLTETNARELISGCNLILDGLDTHRDRLILNRASAESRVPWVYGAVDAWQGQISFFHPPDTACLACLMPSEPAAAGPTPVCGPVPGVIGSLQAILALRYIMTGQDPIANVLLILRADMPTFETVTFDKRPECGVCGSRPCDAPNR